MTKRKLPHQGHQRGSFSQPKVPLRWRSWQDHGSAPVDIYIYIYRSSCPTALLILQTYQVTIAQVGCNECPEKSFVGMLKNISLFSVLIFSVGFQDLLFFTGHLWEVPGGDFAPSHQGWLWWFLQCFSFAFEPHEDGMCVSHLGPPKSSNAVLPWKKSWKIMEILQGTGSVFLSICSFFWCVSTVSGARTDIWYFDIAWYTIM